MLFNFKSWFGKLPGGNAIDQNFRQPMVGIDETALLEGFRKENSSRKGYNKVFCVGYNKTGTTTLEKVLRDLGLKMPDQAEQEKLTSHVLTTGHYESLRKLVSQFDAFQDMPFSQENLYVALDALFPESKFILTVRDPTKWYESLVGFHQIVFGFSSPSELDADFWKGSKYLHANYTYEQQRRLVTTISEGKVIEDWSLQYDQETRIKEFSMRNNDIIRYFRNRPSDLLCIDLSKEVDTSRICEFLEMGEDKITTLPRLNARN